MSVRRRVGVVVATFGMIAAVITVGAPATGAAPDVQATYLVRFVDGADSRAEAARLRAEGRTVRHTYTNLFPGVAVDLPAAAAAALARNPRVATVEADGPVSVADTRTNATWGLDRTDQRNRPLDGKYSYPASAGNGVYVYVVDTGVRASHVDFGGRVVAGATTISDGRGTDDCDGHGTHVAGTSAGATWGMASRATIVPVRVLDCAGSGTWSGVAAGLDWIAGDTSRRPAVANMSLGGGANSTVDNAVTRLINSGVTTVVAAGNENKDACTTSPARVGAALTVGSTTSTDARSSFSNFGKCLDLFAPGSSITSAWITSDTSTNTISGTSMASPHVAGAVAVLLGEQPTLTATQVATNIVNAATTGVVTSAGTGSPNRLLYSDPGPATPPAVSITTTSLPEGTVGTAYSTQLSATGGTGSYTWSLASGSLPSGLTLSASGAITGTPGAAGTSSFSVTVTDGFSSATSSLSIVVVAAVSVTTSSLPGGTTGAAYSAQLSATGGSGTYTWSLAAGSLPAGLSLSSAGAITGTPTTAGTVAFTVRATDSAGRVATRDLSIAVAQSATPLPGAFGKTSPANGATGTSRSSLTFSWAASSNAVSYEICISTTTSCGTGSSGWTSTGSARTSTWGGFASKTVYYWQVRAVNSSGTVLANGGTWWKFTSAR